MINMQRKRRTVGKEFDDYVSPTVSVLMVEKGADGDPDQKEWNTFLKERGYWELIIQTIKFLIHFTIVMVMLFVGAMVMAMIEDPEKPPDSGKEACSSNITNPFNYNESMFWNHLTTTYDVNLSGEAHESFLVDLKQFLTIDAERQEQAAYDKLHSDRRFVFLKWFYFATVTTTTVGYGDVSPKTDMGKIAAIIFFIIGISVMMTLLTRTGAVCTAGNNKLFGVINKYIFKGNNTLMSEELMSTISISFIFFSFLFLGIWYANNVEKMDWSTLDIIYFWIVTFTTVGLGDISYPLEKEVEHVYEHVIYRVFGLALLAGIIDSITAYADYRKKLHIKRQLEKLENAA